MSDAIRSVARFMKLGGQPVPECPEEVIRYPDKFAFLERLFEEYEEGTEALSVSDLVDAFLDAAYVAFTGAVSFAGEEKAIECWEAICSANLSKVDGSLGPVTRNESGKILKPEGFKAPDIENILYPGGLEIAGY